MNDNTNYLCPCIIHTTEKKWKELNWKTQRDLIWFKFYIFSMLSFCFVCSLCFGTIGRHSNEKKFKWYWSRVHIRLIVNRNAMTRSRMKIKNTLIVLLLTKKKPKIKYIKKMCICFHQIIDRKMLALATVS